MLGDFRCRGKDSDDQKKKTRIGHQTKERDTGREKAPQGQGDSFMTATEAHQIYQGRHIKYILLYYMAGNKNLTGGG